ncbi:hypothetical protein SNEBB_010545 [Seison nebaliae]|nr:hypothetical protein SNEBB_010545 [Seison nebaliae]
MAAKKVKRVPELEAEAQAWIESVTGDKFPPGLYEDALKDGVILCKLVNKLQPGAISGIKSKGTSFALRENITKFADAIRKYGVPDSEIFQTVDLFEKRNLAQVTITLFALGRIAQKNGFNGPTLGPKMSEGEKRDWNEEELRAIRDGCIGLQAGTNTGASQAGQNFGLSRHM